MHTLSKKDLSSEELETLRKSRTSTVVLTADGEVHTNEEAQVSVYDLGLFVTVQSLDETPAVLSLGKLCEDHGYSHEWVSGQKPRLTQKGKTSTCRVDSHVRLVVPVLSANPGSSTSSTSSLRDQLSTDLSEEQRDVEASGNGDSKQFSKTLQPTLKKRNAGVIRMIDCKNFLSGWSRSQIIWRIQKHLHPHKFHKTQIRNVQRKWQKKQGSTVF